jgi:hypothetical protein
VGGIQYLSGIGHGEMSCVTSPPPHTYRPVRPERTQPGGGSPKGCAYKHSRPNTRRRTNFNGTRRIAKGHPFRPGSAPSTSVNSMLDGATIVPLRCSRPSRGRLMALSQAR